MEEEEQVVAQTTAPELQTPPASEPVTSEPPFSIEPVVFSKDVLDEYTKMFQNAPGGPSQVIAKTLANELGSSNPSMMSYESLKDGTAGIFDLDPVFKDRTPAQRMLTDDQIITLLATDEEGNPIQGATFKEGFKRDIIPATGGLGGFMVGARAGAAVPVPHPLGRATTSLLGGIIGSLGGYSGGEAITDELLGPERPILPGQAAAYEMGKTAAGVTAWLPLPFMISKNVSLGTAQYLQNLAQQQGAKTPLGVRLAQGIENALNRTGQAARSAPLATLTVEGISGTGAVGGAGFAEQNFPGQTGPRIASEIVGGVGFGIMAQPTTTLLSNFGNIRSVGKKLKESYNAGGIENVLSPLKNKRQSQAVDKIIEVLESEGEDVEAVIARLASDDLGSALVDDAGNPIKLTAGAKAGSPALLAIEASLDQLGSTLNQERMASSQQAIKALRNVILAMSQTGDQDALQVAADLAESVFSADLTSRLAQNTTRVLNAYETVKGPGTSTNVQLSETLYDVIDKTMKQARDKERLLWSNVPTIVVTDSQTALRPPEFIQKWNELTSGTKEAVQLLKSDLSMLNAFVRRKSKELGFTKSSDSAAGDADELGTLTSRELTEMRSLAMDYGRKLEAAGERNRARAAYQMADAMLDDLNNARGEGDAWRLSYDMARAYSRALNDTFTRAFAGEAMASQKTGAERIAPELLAKRVLQGGNDPTYLRVTQINDIGSFAQREGLEGADQTIGTLRGTLDQILRNARAASFDPETGQANPRLLREFVEKNKDVLDAFPDLRNDLLDAEKANILLNETSKANQRAQSEMLAQISFYDIMNPVMSETGRRMYGTESPTSAIARIMSTGNKAPVRSLNNLLKVVKDAPEDVQPQAMTGLKSAILEWAATKAGGSMSGTFSPSTLFDSVFKPMKGSQNRISLADWMLENEVISQMELDNMKTYLTEMVKYEAADTAGKLEGLVEKAGPIMDFYLSITGSAIGSKAHAMMGGQGAGSLIASGRGAETFRNLFGRMPAALQTDVMSELMRNPELLATMMRKPRSEREALGIFQTAKNILIDQGFLAPTRRAAPTLTRETEINRTSPVPMPAPAPEARPAVPAPRNMPGPNQRGSLMPPPAAAPTQGGGAAAPAPIQRAAAQPAPPPTPSGPVDRARFAAFFPNDPTTDLIRQQAASGGIGSLMGG